MFASTPSIAAERQMKRGTEDKIERLLRRLETLVPEPVPEKLDAKCYRWKTSPLDIGHLVPVPSWKPQKLSLLQGVDDEIKALERNTKAFLAGRPASHALLTGPRGCGKTSIVHGVASKYASKGLKVVTTARDRLVDLPELVHALEGRDGKVLVICDELSYADSSDKYIGAKAALDELDGGRSGVIVYATSNRRHIVIEHDTENLSGGHDESGELHPSETTEEKISLSDRFGLWIPVFSPTEDEFLKLVHKWFKNLGFEKLYEKAKRPSLRWAEERGSLNGRIARQFVENYLENMSSK